MNFEKNTNEEMNFSAKVEGDELIWK